MKNAHSLNSVSEFLIELWNTAEVFQRLARDEVRHLILYSQDWISFEIRTRGDKRDQTISYCPSVAIMQFTLYSLCMLPEWLSPVVISRE